MIGNRREDGRVPPAPLLSKGEVLQKAFVLLQKRGQRGFDDGVEWLRSSVRRFSAMQRRELLRHLGGIAIGETEEGRSVVVGIVEVVFGRKQGTLMESVLILAALLSFRPTAYTVSEMSRLFWAFKAHKGSLTSAQAQAGSTLEEFLRGVAPRAFEEHALKELLSQEGAAVAPYNEEVSSNDEELRYWLRAFWSQVYGFDEAVCRGDLELAETVGHILDIIRWEETSATLTEKPAVDQRAEALGAEAKRLYCDAADASATTDGLLDAARMYESLAQSALAGAVR